MTRERLDEIAARVAELRRGGAFGLGSDYDANLEAEVERGMMHGPRWGSVGTLPDVKRHRTGPDDAELNPVEYAAEREGVYHG